MWVGYNLGCTMGFLMGHSAWQMDQFPTCWPMNGLFVHWSRGWGVSSFSERLVDYVTIIVSSWNFQELSPRTRVRSMQKVKVTGQRSRSQVTTQLNRFRTVPPVWIHIWWWNDAYSLIMLRRGALLFFKVILQIARSHGSKNGRIWPRLGVSGL